MKFCSACGAHVEHRVPPGDSLPRYVCTNCGIIHYENPKMVVGCIPEWESRILLCRRAIEPRLGLWTVPAGFMENGETTAEGAMRGFSISISAQARKRWTPRCSTNTGFPGTNSPLPP
jgi:NADH pyrophosphatase NudC (nudix superfamily)